MRLLRQIVYWLLILSGLPWLTARLNRGKVLILVYHGIYDGAGDPVLNFDGMHVRAHRFARQMRYVARRYRVVTLDALLDAPAAGSHPLAVITIDDGFRNVHCVAFPILRRLGLPATLFVPTAFVLGRRGFWWDRLRVMLRETRRPGVRWAIDGNERSLPIRTVPELQAALAELSAVLRALPPPCRDAVLASLAADLGVEDHDAGVFGEPLTVAELRAMADDGLTIGSHGISHDSFVHLSPATLAVELARSKRRLEAWTGRRVEWLAYPHGDFSDAVIDAARRAGYRGAVTTIETLNHAGSNAYALRRIGVHDNMTFAHFIVATSGFRDFVLVVVAAARRLLSRVPPPRPAMSAPPADAQAR